MALKTGLSTSNPMCVAEDRQGNLFFTNGLGRAQRWAPGDTATEDVGLTAPESTCLAAESGDGDIQGVYKYAVRYIDDEGYASNLTEVGTLECTDAGYGLITYSSVPVPTEARVAQKQIWRTTDGQNITYYLDVTTDGTDETSATSSNTDATLRTLTPMRYVTAKGYPNAMRFTPPPTHLSVIAEFKDRMWWAVPGEYSGGTQITVSGTTAVLGVSTLFTSHMEGMYLNSPLGLAEIDSVTDATNLVLSSAITNGVSQVYSILPSSAEYDSLYFSEVGEPESVPEDNKVATHADSDRITGLMPLYGALYILKRNHIYRLTTCNDPRLDTDIALVAERGCLNQQTWCRAEGMAFLMDRQGVYLFDGNNIQAISGPVQNYFQDGTINMSVSKWFSAVHDRRRESVMFFVALDDDTKPQHALCFNYRQQTWWLESYGASVHSSCEGLLGDEPRVIGAVGSTACKFDEGNTDQGSAVAFSAKFGRFKLPEVEHAQGSGVELRFVPTESTQSISMQYYFDGSTTAETAEVGYDDEMGVSVVSGSSNRQYDVNRAEGRLVHGLDGGGREQRTPGDRTLEVEMTGSVSQSLVIEEIRIGGVREE